MITLFKDKNILIIVTILLQSLFIVITNQIIFISQELKYIKKMLPFTNMIVLILTILVLLSIKGVGENIKKKVEVNVLKEYLEQMKDLINTIQSHKHEHTRHIQTIQAMLYLEEISSAKEYIDNISQNYNPLTDIVYVGNPALTVLLNSKRKVAELKNIEFDFAIKCDLNNIITNSSDLCSIIGNIIDNAFEAVIFNNYNKTVGLEIKFENNGYLIYVYNNGPQINKKNMKNIFSPGYTTKNFESRGYGLFLVKKIVDYYHGRIEVRSKEKTVFIVHIPVKDGMIND
ncbi:sensor histidine kinase [Tepidibacter aestuarii]|uniref:sensor histidine kinase n=1 Tax=Tepidibacter aestuarii TaxID=2925782 RepID=UPI0020BFE686|nr:ATP-binding protein [Tepidibacter aestuarii]CAH2213179.1 two-component system, LytTR family, sensor histidine kinase AgrC [Tepidibacter aestuarii]